MAAAARDTSTPFLGKAPRVASPPGSAYAESSPFAQPSGAYSDALETETSDGEPIGTEVEALEEEWARAVLRAVLTWDPEDESLLGAAGVRGRKVPGVSAAA